MTIRNLLHAISIFILSTSAIAVTATEPSLKEIMQGLRNNLVEITDGLLVDDFDRVVQSATGIAQHAPIAAPQVKRIADELGPEMRAFKQFDEQVHALSVSMATAGREKDRDAVIIGYQRMVNGCLACHAAFKDRVAEALSSPNKAPNTHFPNDRGDGT